jgi:hypothetical protein
MSITKAVGRLVVWGLIVYLFAKGALVLRPRETAAAMCAIVGALAHSHCVVEDAMAPPADVRPPATPSPTTSADRGGVLEKRRERHFVGEGQGDQCPKRGVTATPFDDPKMLGVNSRPFGGLLLGQTFLIADGAKPKP